MSTCCQQSISIETFEYSTLADGVVVPHDIFYDFPNYYCFQALPAEAPIVPPLVIVNPPSNPPFDPPAAVPEPSFALPILLIGVILWLKLKIVK